MALIIKRQAGEELLIDCPDGSTGVIRIDKIIGENTVLHLDFPQEYGVRRPPKFAPSIMPYRTKHPKPRQ